MSALALERASAAARVREAALAFFLAPSSAEPLGFFRIAIAMIGLVQVVVLWPYLHQLYGNFGFVQWALIEAAAETWLPSIGKLTLLLQGLGVSADDTVRGVFAVYALALVGLGLGLWTRASAVLAWLMHILTVNTGELSLYGVDTILHVSLFYCAWMPVGDSYSIDLWRVGRQGAPSWLSTLSLRTVQLHLC